VLNLGPSIVLAGPLGLEARILGELAGTGVAMVLRFGLLWVFDVYDPHVDLRARLAQLEARGRP
jgi:hypothetical protein